LNTSFLNNFRQIDKCAIEIEHGILREKLELQTDHVNVLGPIVELAVMALRSRVWSSIAKTTLPVGIATPMRISRSRRLETVTTELDSSNIGFMSLSAIDSNTFTRHLLNFDIHARRAMRFNRNVNQSRALICGALGEMVDNVYEHSQATDSGIVGFIGNEKYLDICVGDAGIGVLSSLKLNPAYAYLADAGMALSLAIEDGISRYPISAGGEGRGHGFSTLFRGLNSLDADVRLRTGNYALEISGRNSLERVPRISEKAHLRGFVLSFRLYF
jgi:hypothetical protein